MQKLSSRCPNCGSPMRAGYLCAKNPILWTPYKQKLTLISGQNDVKLRGWFGGQMPAMLCQSCRTVVLKN